MNKKKFLTIILPTILGVMLVSAIAYYAVVTITLSINQPIDVTGELAQSVNCDAGEICDGDIVIVSNDGDKTKEITISDNSNEDVDVSYIGLLELTEKTVDFSSDVWEIPVDAEKVEVEYSLIDDVFSTEVVDNEQAGYVLIYYKDNSDRFNSPAKAILVDDIVGNLPYDTDRNSEVDGTYDYCATGEYSTCFGAKIWYVPSSAINLDNTLDWSRANEFYYESTLIQYNSDGELTIYPDSSISFRPRFRVDNYAPESQEEIKITIA